MTFQFMCPNSHLLEGEPSQAGQQCQCPQCGIVFLIPQAPAPEPMAAPTPDLGPGPPRPSFPDLANQAAGTSRAFAPPGTPGEPTMIHIPCPKGHILETPPEMIGEDVMCPHCGEMFRLREKDSVTVCFELRKGVSEVVT